MPASSLSKQAKAKATTTTTPGTEVVKLETTSLERGLPHRRTLFDDSVARRAFPSGSTVRAGIHRPVVDWAMAAARFAWNSVAGARGAGADASGDEMEVRG
jgi:hypothetical protein